MCGFLVSNKKKIDTKLFSFLLEKISHRGPDNTKIIKFKNIFFGFKRLSINDLSDFSNQPFEDDNHIFVFNGEIYNHKEIKLQNNFNIKTNSDSLVLFNLIKQKKEQSLKYLNGMFSFVFYDKENNSFFAARDIFGEKPLFYSFTKDGEIILSSEIKSILPLLEIVEIDKDQVLNYFKNSHVGINSTIYKGVYSLPPGHYLICKNKRLYLKKYWSKPLIDSSYILNKENKLNIKKLLIDSLDRQLDADVDVGLFLSGGVDSSLLLSLSKNLKKNLKTFSFTFFEDDNDDLKYLNKLTEKFSTKHYNFDLNNIDILDEIKEIQIIQDEPFSDSSFLPLYILSKNASNHVKSVITGDGADEIFLGYTNWYSRIHEIIKYKILNEIPLISKFLKTLNIFENKSFFKYLCINLDSRNSSDIFSYTMSPFTSKKLQKLGLLDNPNNKFDLKKYSSKELLDIFRNEILETYLTGDILTKSDRMSMYNSIEIRSPYLDKNLVSEVMKIPSNLLYDGKTGKKFLREILSENNIHESIYNRGKKGFGAPVKKIMQKKKVNEYIYDNLSNKNSNIYNYVNYDEVNNDLKKLDQKVWSYFIFELWLNSKETSYMK